MLLSTQYFSIMKKPKISFKKLKKIFTFDNFFKFIMSCFAIGFIAFLCIGGIVAPILHDIEEKALLKSWDAQDSTTFYNKMNDLRYEIVPAAKFTTLTWQGCGKECISLQTADTHGLLFKKQVVAEDEPSFFRYRGVILAGEKAKFFEFDRNQYWDSDSVHVHVTEHGDGIKLSPS